ncbi:MAG: SDR family oxidoreductase [Burkholderiales bacterium]|nr:MAG: SDR family oxidoreductase [Betaproteobacteria bacterium]TAG23842.1 MAG: SDR family oxidoreductase [Burkholderiales bacterium]
MSQKRTLVITGAASGFGLEFARLGAARGDNIVMADVEQVALDAAANEIRAMGVEVLAQRVDVSKPEQIDALAAETLSRFGAPHWVFNNAGVGSGGFVWENTLKDWDWVMGVNVMGVVYGVKAFTPMMLERAKTEPSYRGCIINTASMAGLLNAPTMGIYNVSKHAVVSLTESLYQDLSLVSDQVTAALLCPFFVATGISQSHRNRPAELRNGIKPTASQLVAQAQSDKAVSSGKVSAADVAKRVFEAVEAGEFYIYSHPNALKVVETRMRDIVDSRNPTDPFIDKPEIGAALRAKLRAM